jgi:ABC-type branched-subunit amino acid transport system ATPase component/ABC-type branched-subunit amino acid transport system permease subunit
MSMRRPHPIAILALALVVLPFALHAIGLPYSIAAEVALYALVGLGFNLLIGYTGLVSFGHGMFFGLGAYGTALTQLHFFPNQLVLPFASGVLVASAAGAVVGFFALRRRGVYFSLLTLAFTVLTFYIVYRWTGLTGGENGLSGIRRGTPFGIDLGNQLLFYSGVAAVVLAGAYLAWRVVNSPFGKVLQAIRDNEQRASFIGYPVRRYKLVAFVLSAMLVGTGGAVFALLKQFVSADLTHVNFSGEILVMTVIGGIGTFLGPPLGALFYVCAREILSEYTTGWQFWFGIMFMGFILFSPAGLVGLASKASARLRRDTGTAPKEVAGGQPDRGMPPSLLARSRVAPGIELVSVRGVSKRFGDFVAVRDVALSLKMGEVHALIGPNGAGKTTLFNMISGMFMPNSGSVWLGGDNVSGLPPERMLARGLARSFQITNLFKTLTVFENLRLAVQARHRARFGMWRNALDYPELREETDAMLDYIGLKSVANVRAESLSYGGQRMLEIALALCGAPSVLLLDEPLAGMAAAERERVVDLIRALSQHLGILVVEHDIDRVFAFADKITVMSNGGVLTSGDANHVRGHEEVQRVYLGSGSSAVARSRSRTEETVRPVVLEVRQIDTYYGESHILHGLDLQVRANTVTALLGRNGAGKTTTVNSIVGLVPPRRGEIVFENARIDTLTPEQIARLGIALVPQGRRLFSSLTVAENLKLGGLARRMGSGVHWDISRIQEFFPRLRDKMDNKAGQLSGGEQQMVAIARALSGHVRLLLLDEPFEGLAPAIVEELFHIIDRLKRELTVLIIEHNLDLVLALADEAYVMDRGRVVHRGPAAPLLGNMEYRKEVLWV